MSDAKTVLIPMLIKAVNSEHAARIQFFADLGVYSEPVSDRAIDMLTKIADNEEYQENRFQTMIEEYQTVAKRTNRIVGPTDGIQQILEANRNIKRKTQRLYKKLSKTVTGYDSCQHYEFDKVENELRHVSLNRKHYCSRNKFYNSSAVV